MRKHCSIQNFWLGKLATLTSKVSENSLLQHACQELCITGMTWWQSHKLSCANTRDKDIHNWTVIHSIQLTARHCQKRAHCGISSHHFCDSNFHGCNSAYLQQLSIRRLPVNCRFLQAGACVVLTLLSRLCSLWAVRWAAECLLAPSSSLLLLLPYSSLSSRQLQPQMSTWPLDHQWFNAYSALGYILEAYESPFKWLDSHLVKIQLNECSRTPLKTLT